MLHKQQREDHNTDLKNNRQADQDVGELHTGYPHDHSSSIYQTHTRYTDQFIVI
jgi:hypothetical protein